MSTPSTADLAPLGRTFVLTWLEDSIKKDGKATADDLAAALRSASSPEHASFCMKGGEDA
ncbi:hypothetical protein [Aeromicrobium sp. HA]|uniref:hypothetical protein n=1 Tax=Aeromicrobium sp. HA TaxID=3009077 RepID=UPI0022AF75C9|nr:hypothetical protein [Aeromicrobium sp. HA]